MSKERNGMFGARLRRLREAAGLTQEELAARAGLTSKAISALERGERKRPYPHTVRSLADALKLSEDEHASLLAAVPRRTTAETTPVTSAPEANLPVPPTPLLGRERELEETKKYLREVRLLTLTGTGGVGKTRLVLEMAQEAEGTFPNGATFVALSPLNEPELVLPAIVGALGLQKAEGQTPLESLIAHLREKESLLVLDNFEHVLEAAPSVSALIEAGPG